MSDRDWFDDYMDFKLSCSEPDGKPTGTGGCMPWIFVVLFALWILSELFS